MLDDPQNDHQREMPQTAALEHASPPAANALRHGLTARHFEPLELRQALARFRRQLYVEFQPANTIETVLVDELARHAAALEIAENAEGATLRHGARELCQITGFATADGLEDAVLTAAVSSQAIERLTRYRRAHERAFQAALNTLRQVRLEGPNQPCTALDPLTTEEACRTFLGCRFSRPDWRCPRCGHVRGSWLATRQCWQCAQCRAQIGLRDGLIMEGSPLPLVTWFLALRTVTEAPSISVAELAERLGLRRHKTVRGILAKIHQRLAATGGPAESAGTSAQSSRVLRNETAADRWLEVLTRPTTAPK